MIIGWTSEKAQSLSLNLIESIRASVSVEPINKIAGGEEGSMRICGLLQVTEDSLLQLSRGRRDRLMRVTIASQERFSSCGYFKSKQ
jgi:hypothetical protein